MAVVPFIEHTLELPRGWIYEVEEIYDTRIIRRGRLRESRNLVDERPLTRISVTVPRDRISDISYVRRLYRVMKGRTTAFRVRDPSDYLSTSLGYRSSDEDPEISAVDQPLVATDTPNEYQLYKQYVIGEGTDEVVDERKITKPVEGEILVANEVGAAQPSSAWALDYTTGILVPNESFVGTPTAWGGMFDVPMRFDSEMPRRVEDFRIDEASFSLIEVVL